VKLSTQLMANKTQIIHARRNKSLLCIKTLSAKNSNQLIDNNKSEDLIEASGKFNFTVE
jgi:hypothetical protein